MPIGSGYSVEELVGGLQFCITPSMRNTTTLISLQAKMLTGKTISVDVPKSGHLRNIKYMIQAKEGLPEDQQRLIFCGKQLQDSQFYVIVSYFIRKLT